MFTKNQIVWECALGQDIQNQIPMRFIPISEADCAQLVISQLGREVMDIPRVIGIYTLEGDAPGYNLQNKRFCQPDCLVISDGKTRGNLAKMTSGFSLVYNYALRFLETTKSWINLHPALTCISGVIHIYLHLNQNNAYMIQTNDGEHIIILGGVYDKLTKTFLFETPAVLFHEMGHYILREWISDFPIRNRYDISAIDEGIADAISLILYRPSQLESVGLRQMGNFPLRRCNTNVYIDAGFVSYFITARGEDEKIKALSDVIISIKNIIYQGRILSLESLFEEMEILYKDDLSFQQVVQALFSVGADSCLVEKSPQILFTPIVVSDPKSLVPSSGHLLGLPMTDLNPKMFTKKSSEPEFYDINAD